VTSGLRKVDPSQMTHKNPELRSQAAVVDASKNAPPQVKVKPGALAQAPEKPPRMTLEDGNKWIVVSYQLRETIQFALKVRCKVISS